VKLAIVGDLLWADPLPQAGAVARTLDLLRSAHAAFGNLEASASAIGAPVQKLVRFRIDPNRLTDMATAGFRVMSVANNHSLDYGVAAFLDTLEQLRRRDIVPVGGGDDLKTARRPALLTIDRMKVAFLAAASTLPAGFAAEQGRPGIAPIHVTETFEVDPGVSMEQPGHLTFRAHARLDG
jgi:poly-gamma-glutamate capsule biosynthesis protein CapA/YwtB (metallophosphatase superfamily)